MDASMHRARARAALAGNWGTAILVALIASIFMGNTFNIEFNIGERSGQSVQIPLPDGLEGILGVLGVGAALALSVGVAFSVVHLVMGGVVSMGYARYNLNLIDGRNAEFGDLFSQFDRFAPALVMNLLINLFVALWSLLFVIPGIVASYSYAMAPYIMLEDPGCSAMDALRRSKAMMYGHKGELFVLDLSFIGWILLAGLTMGIGSLWLSPYTAASRASFYRDLQNQGYAPIEE